MSAVLEQRTSIPGRTSVPAEPANLGQCGSWRLTRLISSGRLCQVYQATPADGRFDAAAYALKVLSPQHESDAVAVDSIHREARVGREVCHPNLAPVLCFNLTQPPRYLVMPWLAGVSLAEVLKPGPLPPCTALWIARQVAEALDALHAAGWTHGDVKPENILLSPQRHATLVDLGFARRHDEPANELPCVMGTPAYMAPEQFGSAAAGDIRSDLYSLGVTLYEMLCGRPPFSGRNVAEVIRQHRGARPDNLRRMLPHLPREAALLVTQLLAKEPLRRPQSPRDLIDRLVPLEISLLAER